MSTSTVLVFDEEALLNGKEAVISEKSLFYKNLAKLRITEEDLKKPIGQGLTLGDWFEFLFDMQDGWAALFFRNLNKEYGQRMYPTNQVQHNVVISPFINCYVSMNSFYYPKRTKKALRKLGFFYIDVDPRSVGMTKEEALEGIHKKIEKNVIPKPSTIVDSGGGYYVIYKIEPVFGTERSLKLFGHIETFLVDMLRDVGGDDNAKDACRVLRVPGTINSKYGSERVVKVIEFNEKLIYSFQDFRDIMNKTKGFDLDAWRKLKEKEKEQLPLSPNERKKQKKIVQTWTRQVRKKFSEGSMHAARSIDYKQLILLRGRNLVGFRNTLLWLYGLTQKRLVTSVGEMELKLREMNDMFNEGLTVKEIQDMARHCWKDSYKIKNETILQDKLKITSEEQKYMRILIGKDEKYERNNNRRKEERRNENGLTECQQAKADAIQEAKKLRKQGLKQKEIAKILKVTQSTVSKYLKS